MPWDPNKYNQFKAIRYQPFFDLMGLIKDDRLKNCIDIGCGTGEQTAILSEKFPQANFLGLDPSAEMLSGSKEWEHEHLHFKTGTVEDLLLDDMKWDLVFSNAALQWSENHAELFPKLIAQLGKGGQFAVQMPFQAENVLNLILLKMVGEPPFCNMLNGYSRQSPLLPIDDYAKIMFDAGLADINIFLKVYPIIAANETSLYDFIAGSSLIPYMERLNNEEQELFRMEYIKRIKDHFNTFPAIYSFKRILLYGIKS